MKALKWIKYGRSSALVQSMMPAVLSVVMAAGYPGFNIWMGLLAIVGVALAHLAMNLTDDYFDYRVDMLGDRDRVIRKGFRAMIVKYPYLTDGTESARTLSLAIAGFSAGACLSGLVIFCYRFLQNGFQGPDGTWWIVMIVAVTAILGVFYSAPPFKLAYHGLGELIIGIIFGPLLMAGVFYASCGRMGSEIFWISIPVGLLVLNILFTHSYIDKAGDEASNKMTLARLLGSDPACLTAAYLLNLLPFAIVIAAVCLGFFHPAYLAVLLVLPRAIWLCHSLREFSHGRIDVPGLPPKWLGPMSGMDKLRALKVDWFMIRWYTSRNILSGFCLIITIVKLILLIF